MELMPVRFLLLGMTLITLTSTAWAQNDLPKCFSSSHQKHLLGAFYFDGNSFLMPQTLTKYTTAVNHLDVFYYSSGHLGILYDKDKRDFKLAEITRQNLITFHQWMKKNNIHTKFVLSLGRWNPKIFNDKKVQDNFLKVFIQVMKDPDYGLAGVDVDWENYFSPSPHESHNFVLFLKKLRETLNQNGLASACLSVDVPATMPYAKIYPAPKSWIASVDWVNLMAYEFYLGNPPYTELDGALGQVTTQYPGPPPSYPTVSIVSSLSFYTQAGIPKRQLVLVLPFYGNYFYIHKVDKADNYGLRQPVIDNRSSIEDTYSSIHDNYGTYGHAKSGTLFHQYTFETPSEVKGAHAYWLTKFLIKSDQVGESYRFISYPDPIAVKEITNYLVKQNYLGISAWQLAFDLPYENKDSLLNIIHSSLTPKPTVVARPPKPRGLTAGNPENY